MIELLPCPFCGEPEPVFSGGGGGSSSFNCTRCKTDGPEVHVDDWETAKAAWNRRAPKNKVSA